PQEGILKAIARFKYNAVPALADVPWEPPKDFLELSVEEEEKKIDGAKPPDDDATPELRARSSYQLRVRKERTIAVGVFGADALSQARAEPAVPERTDEKPGANETDVTLIMPDARGKGKEKGKIKITRTARRLRTRSTPGNPPTPQSEPLD